MIQQEPRFSREIPNCTNIALNMTKTNCSCHLYMCEFEPVVAYHVILSARFEKLLPLLKNCILVKYPYLLMHFLGNKWQSQTNFIHLEALLGQCQNKGKSTNIGIAKGNVRFFLSSRPDLDARDMNANTMLIIRLQQQNIASLNVLTHSPLYFHEK